MTKQGITKHNDVNIVKFQLSSVIAQLHNSHLGLEMKCANRIIVVPIIVVCTNPRSVHFLAPLLFHVPNSLHGQYRKPPST